MTIINTLQLHVSCEALLRPGATQVVLHAVAPWNLESRVYVRASRGYTLIPSPPCMDRRPYNLI
jgi:hypothetical protein